MGSFIDLAVATVANGRGRPVIRGLGGLVGHPQVEHFLRQFVTYERVYTTVIAAGAQINLEGFLVTSGSLKSNC